MNKIYIFLILIILIISFILRISFDKVAVIGGGISGVLIGHHLQNVDLYEKDISLGGACKNIKFNDKLWDYSVMYFHPDCYHNFFNLMKKLNIKMKPFELSLSVVYPDKIWDHQNKELFREDIEKFEKEFKLSKDYDVTLYEYLQKNNYSKEFIFDVVAPLFETITISGTLEAPLFYHKSLIYNFLKDNYFITLDKPSIWFRPENGVTEYIEKLSKKIKNIIYKQIDNIVYDDNKYLINNKEYDKVILAINGHDLKYVTLKSNNSELNNLFLKLKSLCDKIIYSPVHIVIHKKLPKFILKYLNNRNLTGYYNSLKELDIVIICPDINNPPFISYLNENSYYKYINEYLEDSGILQDRIFYHLFKNYNNFIIKNNIKKITTELFKYNFYISGSLVSDEYHEAVIINALQIVQLLTGNNLLDNSFTSSYMQKIYDINSEKINYLEVIN